MDLPVKEPKLDSNNLDYLKSVLNIRDGKAEAYLLTRKGYSSSGIAKRIGTSDSTVKTYLNQLEDTYGVEAIYAISDVDEPLLAPLPDIDEQQSSFD
jgi:DNA-binding CsgD family transcriptional regulator